MVGAAAIAALAHHRVKPTGRQRRERLQRLADEGQIDVDLGRARRRSGLGQTGLRQHASHGAVVNMQLPGDRAHPPFFSVVVAKDLSLDISRNHHGRILFARVAAAPNDASGDAETRDEPDPGNADRTSDSANSFAGAVHPRKPRRSPSSASQTTEDHPTEVGVNPDASLYCNAPGSDALARHGQAAPDGWFGNAVPPRAACADALVARSRPCNRFGRDHSNRRSKLGRDSPRKETAHPATRHDVRTRHRHVDERRDCQDNVPACVPSTVWGTASRRNSQVGLGAVLALESKHASPPRAPRQLKPAPRSWTMARCALSSTQSSPSPSLGHTRCRVPIHDDVTRHAPLTRTFSPPSTRDPFRRG